MHSAPVWNFFEKVDDVAKLAMCKYCKKHLSYRTTVTNLKQHLKCKHKKAYNSIAALRRGKNIFDVASTTEDESDEESQATIWNYFERESGGRARCAVCCATVMSNVLELREHLRKKHPKLLGELTTDPDQQEEAANDDIYTEIVYLEETPSKTEKVFPPKKLSNKYVSASKRSRSTSPVANVVKKKRFETANVNSDDEIDSFGNYLICLLKKFPKDVCMKLQRDIINLVMNTKLNSVENENKLVIDNNLTDNEASYYVIQNKSKVSSEQSSDVHSDAVSALQNHRYSITIASDNEKSIVSEEQ